MNIYKNIFSVVSKLTLTVIYVFVIISSFTCKPPNVPSDLNKGFDNPNDPGGTNFTKPEVYFDSLLSTKDNDVLRIRTVTYAWHGNKSVIKFSWKLDSTSWSAWTTDTVLTLNNINDDKHAFFVKALHLNNTFESNTIKRNFEVDILQSPAMYISPLVVEKNVQQEFDVVLRIKKVASLLSSRVLIKYDKTKVQIISSTADPFLASNQGAPILIDKNDKINGYLDLNFGVGLGSPNGIIGTGSLVKIKMKGVSAGTTTLSILKDSVAVLDTLRQKINIAQTDSCLITIK